MCISQRTLKRWANNPTPDKRPTTAPVKQPRQLSEDEEQRILMVCNLPQYVKEPYKRFLENQLRENFDFHGVPVSVYMRKK